jgi:hypothetical protein
MADALNGIPRELPDAKAILPYIGLFTLVTINPTKTDVITPYLPSLSIICGAQFVVAPANTSATAKNVARIFEPLAIDDDTPFNIGAIPISPHDQAFEEKRYWRLPVPAAAIFAALIARLQYDSSDREDMVLANKILTILMLKCYGPSGGVGPSGGRGGGGGSSGGGRRQSKRKNAGGESSAFAKRTKRRLEKWRGDGAGDCGESSDASGETLCSLWVPLRPFWNVDFPPGFRSQYGQSDRREIASSTRPLGGDAPAKSIDTDWDNSDSETGRSEHS